MWGRWGLPSCGSLKCYPPPCSNMNIARMHSRPFCCPPSKARTARDDSDSEGKEPLFLFEAALSGWELAATCPMEAGV